MDVHFFPPNGKFSEHSQESYEQTFYQ